MAGTVFAVLHQPFLDVCCAVASSQAFRQRRALMCQPARLISATLPAATGGVGHSTCHHKPASGALGSASLPAPRGGSRAARVAGCFLASHCMVRWRRSQRSYSHARRNYATGSPATIGTFGDASALQGLQGVQVLDAPPEGGAPFICTHFGRFHADEATACAMLLFLPEFQGMPVVRTRDASIIDRAHIVVDVGGTYEPEKLRFDHHQKSFSMVYSTEYPHIRLSSAGLVFLHYGEQLLQVLCGKMDAEALGILKHKVYDSLIRELDAQDNGVEIADEVRYRIVTHLGARIGRLNPSWQQQSGTELENQRFREALQLAAGELRDIVRGYWEEWWPARDIVREALQTREQVHPSLEVLKLSQACPWAEHLMDFEEAAGEAAGPLVKYVLFPKSHGGWGVKAVPKVRGSFENRLPLPKAWRGLRDEELSAVSGIDGCVFVHASGFIGAHAHFEGALRMASEALRLSPGD